MKAPVNIAVIPLKEAVLCESCGNITLRTHTGECGFCAAVPSSTVNLANILERKAVA